MAGLLRQTAARGNARGDGYDVAYDPQSLRHDTEKAVEDLAIQGVYTYCLTLDPDADRYVARIFGESNYSIVDNVERLPERLPNVFAAPTG